MKKKLRPIRGMGMNFIQLWNASSSNLKKIDSIFFYQSSHLNYQFRPLKLTKINILFSNKIKRFIRKLRYLYNIINSY